MEVAWRFNGEIIAADSRTVYRDMDIGTAKPTLRDRREIPHHLLDIVDPGERFTAADFKRLANIAIKDIASRGKLPVLVGGTGLYIDAVIFDYKFGPDADLARRKQLQDMSVEVLKEYCYKDNIELPRNNQNKRHLIRAIELGGILKQDKQLRKNTLVVGTTTANDRLRQRITDRARQMLDAGIMDEVKDLIKKYNWQGESFTGNIYPLFKSVLEGRLTEEQAIEQFIHSDMQLAKRQLTWLKRNPFIQWSDDQAALLQLIEHFLTTKHSIA